MRFINYINEDMKILDFPELRQMYNYDCGASSVQSVLAFCGIDAREDHILNIANTTPKEGTLNDDVKRVLDYYEINYKEGTFTIEDLKKHIDANQPTIISLQAYADYKNIDYKKSWDEGHNVVVIGYDSKNIYFEDPSSFKRTYLSFDELDDRWHDTDKDDKKVDHWGIVIKERGKFKHNDTTKMESKSSRFKNYLNEAKDIENAYIEKYDTIGNIEIWKVDGSYIRTHIDDQFTNFGHHYQYKFIPENEFWLDKEAKEDDILFYIDHLIMEHRLMKDGMPYSKAIVIADKVERDSRRMSGDAKKLTDGGKRLPDGEQVHIRLWKKLEDGLSVWIVDGRLVRSVFDIDFTEGGHDYVYEFVPENEVWIDNDVVHKERGYVLLHELHERNIMSKGTPYSKAHMESSKIELQCRHNPDELHDALAEEGWT